MTGDTPSRWQQPIFVASMGRSGSTLLQRLLNVHPGVTVWGEHGGFLTGLLESYAVGDQKAPRQNLTDGYEHRHMVIGPLQDSEVFKPWVSPFLPEHLQDAIRSLILDLFTRGLAPDVRWGFKEIRYTEAEMRALMTMFPEAHLVVLARDITGYASSRFFAFGHTDFDLDTDAGADKARKRLASMIGGWMRRYEGLLEVHDDFASRSSVVAYSDLTPGSDRIAELFRELGEVPPTAEDFGPVLEAKAGSSYRHNAAARENRERLAELIAEADIDRAGCDRLVGRLGLA